VRVGPNGIREGQELTYFYPSTEWEMAQPFECYCGEVACKGLIDGAGRMGGKKVEGYWANKWVREALEKQEVNGKVNGVSNGTNGTTNGRVNGSTNGAVKNGLNCAGKETDGFLNGKATVDEAFVDAKVAQPAGAQRQGASARELAGEMGGDTK